VLSANQRSTKSRKPSRRKTTGSQRRTTGNRRRTGPRTSQSRYETTARATPFKVRRRGTTFSLKTLLEQQRRRRNRRSRTRLGKQYKATTTAPRGVPVATLTPRQGIRISLRTVLNILALGLLGWVLVWFFVSNRFYVNQIMVEGNQRVSTDAIVTASGVRGYSIFWINGREVVDNITAALPPIRQVRVRYGLPNVITLTVEEQGAQIMWLVAGKRHWVDDEGQFHPAQGGDAPKLLVRDIRPGLPTEVDAGAVVAARQLTRLLPDLKEVSYAPVKGLHFVHDAGWIVYLGIGDDMPYKMTVLHAIERQLSSADAPQPSLVDIRFPETPYYRFPDPEAGG
jgi:cell division septal protein FtsQ